MKIKKPIKILLGFLTAWVVIAPFLGIVVWFSFMFMAIGAVEYQAAPEDLVFPAVFLPFFLFILCSSFLQFGLSAFYLTHVILNKTGNDFIRVVLGISVFIFPYIAMPVYYFIYILPENPPQWARAVIPTQIVSANPLATNPIQPNENQTPGAS
jgi:hypothetical protein